MLTSLGRRRRHELSWVRATITRLRNRMQGHSSFQRRFKGSNCIYETIPVGFRCTTPRGLEEDEIAATHVARTLHSLREISGAQGEMLFHFQDRRSMAAGCKQHYDDLSVPEA